MAVACGSTGPAGDRSASASGSASSRASVSATAQPAAITIDGFSYVVIPAVSPGATITVTNKDSVAHTVTADSAGGFDAQVPGNSHATFTAPRQAGAYPFHCTYHPNMHAQLVVVQPE
jgi:plastocyanin